MLLIVFLFCCCEKPAGIDDTTSPPGQATIINGTTVNGKKIIAPDSGCYTGVFIWTVENNISLLDNFIALTGKTPNFVGYFSHWGSSYDNIFDVQGCTDIFSRGCIPYITWMPGGSDNDIDYNNAAILDGNHDAYIISYANAIKTWGHPVLLRPMMEQNTNWFCYCPDVNGNTTDSYIATWKYIYDKFESLNVTNVTWLFNCVPLGDMTSMDPLVLYPGDDYVDWVSVDGYGWTPPTWCTGTFDQVFSGAFNTLSTINKPLMIAEIGCGEFAANPNWKTDWMNDAFNKIQYSYSNVKGFNWFEYNKEQDWRITSSANSLNAYMMKVSNNSYFLSGQAVW